MPQPSSIPTTDPALIATFYGPRGKLRPLIEWLNNGLGLTRGQRADINHFRLEFDPPAASDTSVVQVVLSVENRRAEEVWPSFCQRLSRILDSPNKWQHVWGYTLVYQAVTEEPDLASPSKQAALRHLFAHARPLLPVGGASRKIASPPDLGGTEGSEGGLGSEGSAPLADSAVEGGHLWLTHLPLEQDGPQAATIYIALGPAATETALVRQVLLGVNAMLLMPDLIAHKGYHQRRQYRQDHHPQSDPKHRFESAANSILENMDQLLGQNERQVESQLEQLTEEYRTFLRIVPIFRELHLGIERQLYNFTRWQTQTNGGDIFELHQNYLETTLTDLKQLMAKGEDTLQVSKSAIDFVQSRLDKARQAHQQQIETLLALVATAFTVAQILDRELISAFISAITGIATATEQHTLLLGGIQLVVTILFALAVAIMLKRSRQ